MPISNTARNSLKVMEKDNVSFFNIESEATYWAYRVYKAAEYLEYAKDMHRKVIKRLTEYALREEEWKEEDGLTEQRWLGNE